MGPMTDFHGTNGIFTCIYHEKKHSTIHVGEYTKNVMDIVVVLYIYRNILRSLQQ